MSNKMKRTKALLGFALSCSILFGVATLKESTQHTANVAWGVHEYTKSEAAGTVAGTGAAIGTYGAVSTAIKGASWGARIGAYAGPIGAVAGAVVGGL
jgi:hypothetical protein